MWTLNTVSMPSIDITIKNEIIPKTLNWFSQTAILEPYVQLLWVKVYVAYSWLVLLSCMKKSVIYKHCDCSHFVVTFNWLGGDLKL